LAIYCDAEITIEHADIVADGDYYLAWAPYPSGVPAVPVAAATAPDSIEAGEAVFTVSFGTDEAVALFATPTGDAIPGRWHLIDVSDADHPLDMGLAAAGLHWGPEPDGYVPTSVSRAATQAWVTAAIAVHTSDATAAHAASAISVAATPANYSAATADVEAHLAGVDTALGTVAPLSDTTPQALGVAAAGDGTTASRHNHVHDMPDAADVGAEASGAVATHAALTTGVHGVGAGTIAQIADITAAQAAAIALAVGTTAGDRLGCTAAGVWVRQPCLVALPDAGAGAWAPALTPGAHHTVTRTGIWTGITPSGLEIGEDCGGTIAGAFGTTTTGVTADATGDLADIDLASVGWYIIREASGYRMTCWEKA